MNRKNRMKVAIRRGARRVFVATPLVFLTVAGAGCPSLFESNPQRTVHVRQAVVGRDGAHTVSGTETPNRYARLPVGATLAAGATTVTVDDVNGNFLTAVAQGDLLLIIQMAGATIDTTSNDATYGTITTLGSAGRYEFVGVEARNGAVITLACGLKNSYTRAGKTQVIRVPQYTTLTIPAGASLTAPAWDGDTGGVVAVHAETTLDLSGSIDVAAKGFRGGQADNQSVGPPGTTAYFSNLASGGAEKGEGIAGYEADLGATFFGRGAPANAGGGGDSHNAGGGGGANAAANATWTGQGVMQQCGTGQAWNAAWLLDPGYVANGNVCANSPGGGRGGYSYSGPANPAPNPLVTGPGDASWGGDDRREVGGLGGRPLPGDPAARLFLGGGGGAGDGNNGIAGRGGRGGGLVFVIAGAVAGAGTISANGEAGGDAVFANGDLNGGDGPGGGGGGGSVVVHATSIATTVTITANGGRGGNHVGSTGVNEVEGPGGGGGGGYIALAGGSPTASAAGGPAGTTDRTSMSTFAADGATAGHAGVTDGDASSFLYCATSDLPVTTIATHPTTFSNVTTGSFTFTNTQTPVTYECKIDTANWVPCNASYTTPTLDDGQHTLSVRSTNLGGVVENPPVTFTWTIDTVRPVTTIATHPANPSANPTGVFTFTNTESPVTYECQLDGGAWAPCNASTPTSATYATPVLGDGSHTLTVRSTDQAGNVDQTPPSYTWIIEAGALDAGSSDGGGLDGGVVQLDAEGLDQSADVGILSDVAVNKDVAAPDLASDVAIVVNPDTAPVQLDSAVDQGGIIDLGAIDLQAIDGGLDLGASDTRPSGAEPSPDARVAPEPNPDSAVVVPPDAAVPNKDAAVSPADLKVMGSGFCTVARPGAPTRAPLLLVGFGLAALLVRRRRR